MKHYVVMEKREDGTYFAKTDIPFDNADGFDITFKVTERGVPILALRERWKR